MQEITGSLVDILKGEHSFGQSIAVQGNTLVVGADDTPIHGKKYQGCVYVFKKHKGKWVEKQILSYPLMGSDSFYGWDVSISEDEQWIAVGVDDDDAFAPCGGSVHVFKFDGKVYNLFQILYNKVEKSYFGFSVYIHNDEMLIGAPSYRTEKITKTGQYSGTVQLYKLENEYWIYKTTFHPSFVDPKTFYGGNVRISDDFYFISAHKEGLAGVVYVYNKKFELVTKLKPSFSNLSIDACFGKSMAINGNNLLVGAMGENKAYLFHTQTLKAVYDLYIIHKASCFGYSVDINSNKIAVSDINSLDLKYENLDWDGKTIDVGYCYIFQNDTQIRLYIDNKHLGHCVRLSENEIFIGSPHINKVFISEI